MAAPLDTESKINTLILATETNFAGNNSDSETVQEHESFSNDKVNVNLCLLCGLPASGKSTFLDNIVNNREIEQYSAKLKKSVSVLCIDYDSLLYQIEEIKPFSYTGTLPEDPEGHGEWKNSRMQILSAVEAVIQQVKKNGIKTMIQCKKPEGMPTDTWLKLGHVINLTCETVQTDINDLLVVIDDNMFFRSMRYDYYKLAKKYRTGYCQVFMNCSTNTAIARNKQREECRRVSEDVIRRMASKLEPPDAMKYSWEKHSVFVDSERDVDIDQILAIIFKSFMDPVQPSDVPNEEECFKSRFQCSTNLLHQADLILRKCVADYMAECKVTKDFKDLKHLGQQALTAKGKILGDLKSGHISLTLPMTTIVKDSAQDTSSEFYQLVKNLFLTQLPASCKT